MAKIKYYYDKNSLSYQRIKLSPLTKLKKIIYFSSLVALTSFLLIVIFFNFFDSPKEKKLKREIHNLTEQYKLIDDKFNQVELVLDDLQNRDDNIYRVIFEAEPIASSIRKAGYGGINRYKDLEGYNNSDLIIQTTKKIDQISKQMYIQSKSFDEIVDLAKMLFNPSYSPKAKRLSSAEVAMLKISIPLLLKICNLLLSLDFPIISGNSSPIIF